MCRLSFFPSVSFWKNSVSVSENKSIYRLFLIRFILFSNHGYRTAECYNRITEVSCFVYFIELQALMWRTLKLHIFLYCQNFVQCLNFGRKRHKKSAHPDCICRLWTGPLTAIERMYAMQTHSIGITSFCLVELSRFTNKLGAAYVMLYQCATGSPVAKVSKFATKI